MGVRWVWAYAQTPLYRTHIGRLLDTDRLCGTLSETSRNPGRNEEKRGFHGRFARAFFRPHNPLVVCSNHTGPTSLVILVSQCGWLLRWCDVSIPGNALLANGPANTRWRASNAARRGWPTPWIFEPSSPRNTVPHSAPLALRWPPRNRAGRQHAGETARDGGGGYSPRGRMASQQFTSAWAIIAVFALLCNVVAHAMLLR